MKSKLFAGFGVATLALAMGAVPAQAAESFSSKGATSLDQIWAKGGKRGGMGHGMRPGGGMKPGGWHKPGGWSGGHRWGSRPGGRWHGGHKAPGGWKGYQRPFRGYVLPSYWINSGFYLQNYSVYGLSQPSQGYGWSRYYDDAVLTDSRGQVYDSRHDIDWSRYEGGYSDAYNAGYRDGYDAGTLAIDDSVYATSDAPAVTQGGSYDGAWSGNYTNADGSVYQGSWSGTVQGEDGRIYQGDYTGKFIGEGRYVDEDGNVTYTGRPGAGYAQGGSHWGESGGGYVDPGPQYAEPDYRDRAELIERCRRDNGLGGALIGGVVGGVAGNRIAGRGNRTEGTLIGAGVGAIAGAVIDKSERDPCDEFRRPAPPQHQGYPGGYRPAPSHGYYPAPAYYYPAPTVTTITIQPSVQTTTTTTVTEEYYVTKHAPKKKWKPAPKSKKVCRC